MKHNEQQMLDTLRTIKGLEDLKESENQYKHWDAESDKYVVELKWRHVNYEDQFIESYKFNHLMNSGKQALYVVCPTDRRLYIFHLNKLVSTNYDFKWSNRQMKKQTEFENNERVSKYTGLVSKSDAYYTIPLGGN